MINGIWPKEYCRSCRYALPDSKKLFCQKAKEINDGVLGYILPGSAACKLYKAKPKSKRAKKKKQMVGDNERETEVDQVQDVKQSNQMDIGDFGG